MRIHKLVRNAVVLLEATEPNVIKEEAEIVERFRLNKIPFHMIELGEAEHHQTAHLWQITFPLDYADQVVAMFPGTEMGHELTLSKLAASAPSGRATTVEPEEPEAEVGISH